MRERGPDRNAGEDGCHDDQEDWFLQKAPNQWTSTVTWE